MMNQENPLVEMRRLKVVLSTIVINVLAVCYFASVSWSDWKSGLILNLVDNFILITYLCYQQDRVMLDWMIFGIAVGVTELYADAWLVSGTHTLDYSIGGGPMLWYSPMWMPFAWEIVAIQLGYLGGYLWRRFGRIGLLMIGLIGAVNIPFYEEMARFTKWWTYSGCKTVLHTPYFIILGEFLIAIGLTIWAQDIEAGKWVRSVLNGIFGGILILISYMASYGLIEFFL